MQGVSVCQTLLGWEVKARLFAAGRPVGDHLCITLLKSEADAEECKNIKFSLLDFGHYSL